MKKRERLMHLLQQYHYLFRCPVCRQDMGAHDACFVCTNWHSFDLSTRGYINLLLRSNNTHYDRSMWAARQALANTGFFTPMLQAVSHRLLQEFSDTSRSPRTLLDAGCGEGSSLSHIVAHFRQTAPSSSVQGVGIDISKDGIRFAARGVLENIWCVADLAQLPLQNHQFEGVLNILSPANYREFGRVLAEQGLLVKVVPGRRYLIELREMMYEASDKRVYNPERVVRHFSRHFTTIEKQHVVYTVAVDHDYLTHVIAMTPLFWNAGTTIRKRIMEAGLTAITVDMYILVGKKSNMLDVTT